MRILLVDDEPQVRLALRRLLEQEPGISVVGEATDAEELLSCIEAACPDLVLLDWGLPGMPMGDPLSVVRRTRPTLPVIVLSGRPEAEEPALASGADAFVSKADPPEKLLAAIHAFA